MQREQNPCAHGPLERMKTMTLIGFDSRIILGSRRLPTVANSITVLMTAARATRRWRERRANARILESLPFDLRKDLGWPPIDRPARNL